MFLVELVCCLSDFFSGYLQSNKRICMKSLSEVCLKGPLWVGQILTFLFFKCIYMNFSCDCIGGGCFECLFS